MSFSCILLYCIDLSFLIENFQLKANNSFECTKTEPTNYQYSLKLYYDWQRCHAMRGSRNFPGIFVRGGGPGQSDKKSSDNVFFFFLVLSLFDISQMVIFFNFSRFQRGSNISRGEGVQLFSVGGGGPIAYSL